MSESYAQIKIGRLARRKSKAIKRRNAIELKLILDSRQTLNGLRKLLDDAKSVASKKRAEFSDAEWNVRHLEESIRIFEGLMNQDRAAVRDLQERVDAIDGQIAALTETTTPAHPPEKGQGHEA